jgi:integrase
LKHRPAKHMRHTFATLHIAAGESITWVSQTLGHANVDITLKKYNRFIPNLTREDGSAFEAVMEGKKGNIRVKNSIST